MGEKICVRPSGGGKEVKVAGKGRNRGGGCREDAVAAQVARIALSDYYRQQ